MVSDVKIGELTPAQALETEWEARSGGIWIRRRPFHGTAEEALTGVDVLFGDDAVDPRPQWTLMNSSLLLKAVINVPCARLSLRCGRGHLK